MKKIVPLLLSVLLLLAACDTQYGVTVVTTPAASSLPPAGSASAPLDGPPPLEPLDSAGPSDYIETPAPLDPDGYYYDLENVVLYLDTYEELPPNYITKAEARELGWQGGSVEQYLEGAAIGGDRFGNREGLLPTQPDRQYTECDLNTDGQSSRGAERLIFSNDGLYFYTADHYGSFTEVWVEGGEVLPAA